MRLFLLCAALGLTACDLEPGEVRTEEGPRDYTDQVEQRPDAEEDQQPAGRDAHAGVYDLAPTPADFFDYAAQFSLMEIEANQIAAERAESEEVRGIARDLLAYHREASRALQDLAEQGEFDMPGELNVRRQAAIDDLESDALGGFDANYLQRQKVVYEEAADVFRAYAAKGENQALQNFAVDHANDIRDQSEQLRELRDG